MAQIDAPKEGTLWRFKSIPTASSTCKTCKPALNEKGRHPGISLKSLELSAESGCQDCRLQYLGVLQALGTRYATAVVSVSFNGRFTWIRILSGGYGYGEQCLTLYFFTEKNQRECSWPLVGIGRSVGPRKTTYLGILLEWLKTCRESHLDCHKNENVDLPTRVLDVGLNPSDGLRLSELPGSKGCYLALSHCWGGAVPMRTMRNNIDAYKGDIDFTSLPKNFQDAVRVTRSLGLRFLWIDALCIIQDDLGDWERESGNMARVYQNAYLVVGADMSENSHGGFLENAKSYNTKGVPIATVDDEATTIYARCQYSRHWNPCALRNRGMDETFGGREPLMTRAWTLQEQMLASRMVHFARGEVIWECDSALSCECMELDRGISSTNWKRRSREALRSSSTAKFELWYDIVLNFRQRSITKSSDMLPALSGLAHHFQEHGAGPYLAGVWQNDLPQGLLWSRLSSGLSFRASPYRAPSWSWASIQGENAYDYDTLSNKVELQHVYARIVDSRCSAAGEDPCGAVEDGWIEICAPVFEIVYRNSSWHRCKAKATQPWILENFDFEFTPNEDEVLFCLFIGEITKGPTCFRCRGLILRKLRDSPDCTFERVGLFETELGSLHTFVDDIDRRETVRII